MLPMAQNSKNHKRTNHKNINNCKNTVFRDSTASCSTKENNFIYRLDFNNTYYPFYNPIDNVEFVTDTINANQSALMLYTSGKIIRFYQEGNNSFRMQLPYFAHENKHKQNAIFHYHKNKNLTPIEYAKAYIWDEVTANLCAILTARYEYLCSNNPEIILNKYTDNNCYMKFYFDEIKSHNIQPNINHLTEYEKALLINGTLKMWQEKYWPIYKKSTIQKINYFINTYGVKESSTNIDYLELRHKMLFIGGINFDKYLIKDIYIENDNSMFINQIAYIKNTNDWNTLYAQLINTKHTKGSNHFKTTNKTSDIQYISLPDFTQPILTNISQNQINQITNAIQQFEQYPEVLKKCNTKAQIDYLTKYPIILQR